MTLKHKQPNDDVHVRTCAPVWGCGQGIAIPDACRVGGSTRVVRENVRWVD